MAAREKHGALGPHDHQVAAGGEAVDLAAEHAGRRLVAVAVLAVVPQLDLLDPAGRVHDLGVDPRPFAELAGVRVAVTWTPPVVPTWLAVGLEAVVAALDPGRERHLHVGVAVVHER